MAVLNVGQMHVQGYVEILRYGIDIMILCAVRVSDINMQTKSPIGIHFVDDSASIRQCFDKHSRIRFNNQSAFGQR